MVTTKTIRCISRRMLLAFLATASGAGVAIVPAAAETSAKRPTASGPAANVGLQDLDLAPGEKVIKSSEPIGQHLGDRLIQHDGGSYQIIDPSSVPTATGPVMDPMAGEMPMMGQTQMYGAVPMGGCANGNCGGGCATGNCGGGYGTGLYSDFRPGRKGSGGNVCGPTCNPYIYTAGEAVYMKNNTVNNYTQSPDFNLSDFDYEFGLRGTIGMVPDCRNGYEVSFVTPIEWEQQATATGNPQTFLAPVAPLVAGQFTAFTGSTAQLQSYKAQYYSLEANRTLIGWEVCKLLYGLRYVNYKEDYFYGATNGAQVGFLTSAARNRLIGAQVGAEMTYPLTCKLWTDFRGRAGIFADFAENQFRLANGAAPTTFVRGNGDHTDAVGLFEFGGGMRYYFNGDFHIRAGAEMWYLSGVATAAGQFSNLITQTTGRRTSTNDDVLLFGITAGAEYKF